MDTYKVTNTWNGKFYVGSTKNFEKRKRGHLTSKENYPFQNALRKNPEAFEWEVWTDDSDEPVLEQALLDMWFGKEQCYNLNPYASRPPSPEGKEVPVETREKISETMRGREINEKTRSAVSRSNKTRVLSQKTLKKKSESMRGARNPSYGKKWWVNADGDKLYQAEGPGEGWQRGMKWKEGG
jgi:group I intron endonuclease